MEDFGAGVCHYQVHIWVRTLDHSAENQRRGKGQREGDQDGCCRRVPVAAGGRLDCGGSVVMEAGLLGLAD